MMYSMIEDVRALPDYILLVTVGSGDVGDDEKIVYDLKPLMEMDPDFRVLEDDPDLYQNVEISENYSSITWGGPRELLVDELIANGVSLDDAILDPELSQALDYADDEGAEIHLADELYDDDSSYDADMDRIYRLDNGLSDDLDDDDFSSASWSDMY